MLFPSGYVSANEDQTEINEDLDPNLEKELEVGKQLSKYVHINEDNSVEFDKEQAINDGMAEDVVNESANVYENYNQNIKQNSTIATTAASTNSSCSGISSAEQGAFTATIYLNSCDTSTISGIMTAGGGVAQATALIPALGAVPGTIVNAVLQVGSGLIQARDNGSGVEIQLVKNPTGALVPYWVNPQ